MSNQFAISEKIAVEEHFGIEQTLAGSMQGSAEVWAELKTRLADFSSLRLRDMDACRIRMMGIALNAPAIQGVGNASEAVTLAKRANDLLAEQIVKRPDRFFGFAALPMQDPEAAVLELQRSIKELGFKGVLVNGFSEMEDQALFYDAEMYRPFWKALQELDVPFYLHPRNPLPRWTENFDDHQWLLGPTWAFTAETAIHALRLIGSGLFDEFPRLNIILGHLGEGIPAMLWRMDNYSRWMKFGPKHRCSKPLTSYFRENFYFTTSGNLYAPLLDICLREFGHERIMFAIDYPFDDIEQSSRWLDSLSLDPLVKKKIGSQNAVKLLRL